MTALILLLLAQSARDEVTREDLRRAQQALDVHKVQVEWVREYPYESYYIHDPVRTAFIRTHDLYGNPYPPARLAGAFLHEVGGHGYAFSEGCGTNLRAIELDAWYMQMRFHASAGAGALLDKQYAEQLELFKEDPAAFERSVLEPYYGTEIDPEEESIAQQRAALLKRQRTGAGRAIGWFLGRLGLAEGPGAVEERLRRLDNDEKLEERRLESDRRWREHHTRRHTHEDVFPHLSVPALGSAGSGGGRLLPGPPGSGRLPQRGWRGGGA